MAIWVGGTKPLPDCFAFRLRQNGLAMTVSGQRLKTGGVQEGLTPPCSRQGQLFSKGRGVSPERGIEGFTLKRTEGFSLKGIRG